MMIKFDPNSEQTQEFLIQVAVIDSEGRTTYEFSGTWAHVVQGMWFNLHMLDTRGRFEVTKKEELPTPPREANSSTP